ncbi:uncharacterized protein LOC118224234 isoform X2 [Anguilla anguilla]|uniref:uncharacterized protein LOC118224234 isoform X2 n=1 Tax=Anguilla anguilla TaxID=7936 RepID=UPI0015B11084|nr:uncharacterized protein LOC118224234 isoform X2 [Anguilla anguilla]
MSITGGSLTRMKAIRMIAMRTALVLSCLFLAGRSATSIGSQSAPRPCVVLRTDLARGVQPPEGRLGSGGGWEWEPAGAPGSIAVTQGCTLTVWTEEGGHQTFPSGTQVHLKGWEWISQTLAFHCSCEKEGVQGLGDQWETFKEQHIDPTVDRGNNAYCNKKMVRVNWNGKCKLKNTLIHATKENVIQVCRTRRIGIFHFSTQPFNLTECKHDNTMKPCKYIAKNVTKRIVIVCQGGKPVHFNGTRNESI